jgi:hypothetical protein
MQIMAIFGNVGLPTLLAMVTSEMKVGKVNMEVCRMLRGTGQGTATGRCNKTVSDVNLRA